MNPPPLEYVTPRFADSRVRRSLCRFASGIGGASLVLSVLFAVMCWLGTDFGGTIPTAYIMGAIAGVYMIGGVLYVIGSAQVMRSNRFWEKLLIGAGCVHCVVIALTVGLYIFALFGQAHAGRISTFGAKFGSLFCLGFLAAHLLALGRMAFLSVKVGKEI